MLMSYNKAYWKHCSKPFTAMHTAL